MEMVPYNTFSSEVFPATAVGPLASGQYHAVHFTVLGELLGRYLEKVEVLFDDRDEVILVASGLSAQGVGFIVLEWDECQIDPWFLQFLEDEDGVTDACVYIRSEEVE